jgi:glyoxylase-like metal-dependent hydrolase (beta-lactamase superfamily II)
MDDARMNAAAPGLKGAFENVRRTFAQMPAAMLQQFVPGTEPVRGISSIAAYGHTPGHTLFQVGSGRNSFTYIGDLTNVPALFARNPDWAVMFDMDAEAARLTRREVFSQLVRQGGVVGGFHFPFPALGRMVPSGQGFAFEAMS